MTAANDPALTSAPGSSTESNIPETPPKSESATVEDVPALLFDGYDPESFFDEAVDGTTPRPHYAAAVERLNHFSGAELRRREAMRENAFRSQGITFTVYGDDESVERTFPMDLLPRIIPSHEWDEVEAGLKQRVRRP